MCTLLLDNDKQMLLDNDKQVIRDVVTDKLPHHHLIKMNILSSLYLLCTA